MSKLTAAQAPILSPFAIIADTREQAPYTFDRIRARAPRQDEFVRVEVRRGTLDVGDYAAAAAAAAPDGLTSRVRIERKSIADLFGTLGAGRDRFRREMERAADERLRLFLVAECTLADCIIAPPLYSELPGLVVVRTLESWAVRYDLRVWWCGNRAAGEQVTYRLLEFAVQDAIRRTDSGTAETAP